MANIEDRPWVGLVSSRKLLPPTLILAGLILAIIGALLVASSHEVTVYVGRGAQYESTRSTIPGSPWGFVILGSVVFLAGCAMQAFAWRLAAPAADSKVASQPAPVRADERDLGREQQPAPLPG